MKSKYFTPELARFLFDRGLLDSAEKMHEKFISSHGPFKYPIKQIVSSFIWNETQQGYRFWEKLHKEYIFHSKNT